MIETTSSGIIRSFIAIELPENIIRFIHQTQEDLKKSGLRLKWVNPDNLHLTLKFFGDISTAAVPNIDEVMNETIKNQNPFTLSVKGLGVFPSIKRARVLWMGLKGETARLIEFQKNLDNNLETLGFPKEDRPFKAHLTIARMKDPVDPERLIQPIEKFCKTESENFTANQLILFKSDLKPSGAVYTELVKAILK